MKEKQKIDLVDKFQTGVAQVLPLNSHQSGKHQQKKFSDTGFDSMSCNISPQHIDHWQTMYQENLSIHNISDLMIINISSSCDALNN